MLSSHRVKRIQDHVDQSLKFTAIVLDRVEKVTLLSTSQRSAERGSD